MDKEQIREFGYELGADAMGFAAIEDYRSEKSPDPRSILPNVKSIIVLGYREINGAVESENARISMASRMGGMNLSRKNNYLMARHIEKHFKAKAAPVPLSYPLDMGPEVMGLVGDVSIRHAAVAAGLGVFGRHNLVIHPQFGTRIIFTTILTELPLRSDPSVPGNLCNQCGLCVEACQAKALDEEGKTDVMKCLRASQPYGIGGAIRYLRQFIGIPHEEQKALLSDPILLSLYQAQFIGFQYTCFKCMAVCPACTEA
ncbi:MAG: epoxyqueuosine reductase [Deltaproteobacteria bacterium]|nr:epoxyqueuosine reductase [Deltaproteobacteria bacterium]MBW2306758.1 epoxyqueuosine reductase [Deltaproteobacteria bacterium]